MDASEMPAWRRALYHFAALIPKNVDKPAEVHGAVLFLGTTLKSGEDTSLLYIKCKQFNFAHVKDIVKIRLLQQQRPDGEHYTFHVFTLAYVMTQYISNVTTSIPEIVKRALVSCQPLVVFRGSVTRECQDWLHVWRPPSTLTKIPNQMHHSHKHSFKFSPLESGEQREHVAHVAVLAGHGDVVSVSELVAACNYFQNNAVFYTAPEAAEVLYRVSNC
jgi:hypothetical protein